MAAKKAPKKGGASKKGRPAGALRATSRAGTRAKQEKDQAARKPGKRPRFEFPSWLTPDTENGSRSVAQARATKFATHRLESLGTEGAPHKRTEPTPDPPGPDSDVAARIDHCVELMAVGLWDGFMTRQRLAAVWGVQDTTIRDYAAEASRRLRLDPVEVEAARIQHRIFCERVRDEALATTNIQTGMPDFGNALKADERIARLRGAEPPPTTKMELTGKDGGPIKTQGPVIMVPPEREE
jgi:hypothetical protein